MAEKWEEMKQDKKKRKRDMDKERVGEGTRSKRQGEGDRYRGKDGCRAAPECRGGRAM